MPLCLGSPRKSSIILTIAEREDDDNEDDHHAGNDDDDSAYHLAIALNGEHKVLARPGPHVDVRR